jgi:hypothetical protein
MNDINEIELDVALEFRDYLWVNFWFFFRKLKFLLALLAVATIYIFLSAVVLLEGDEKGNNWGLLFPLGLFGLLFGSSYYGARRYWNSNAAIRETKHYTFTKRGIDTAGRTAGGYIGWENVREAVENRNSFILFISTQEMFIIPKRFFTSESQVEVFRTLLRHLLGRKAKLK